MSDEPIKLRISTPTEPIPPGRGFYQLEEDALYVQVGLFSARRSFFSYLENDKIRLDLDRTGRLIFLEVAIPRRQWLVDPDLYPPHIVEPADIRWLDFRAGIPAPSLTANEPRSTLRLTFSQDTPARNYYLAEEVIVSVDERDTLVHIWINHIIDDLAGQEIGAFRKKHRSDESFFA